MAERPAVAPPALRASGLTVGYRSRRGAREVLAGLDLHVQSGELVCLLGPNGAGKSTLLRTIARIQPPLAGAIAIGGVELESLTQMELARRLGVVLTDRIVVGAMTGRRVVELGRYPHVGFFGRLTPRDREVAEWAITAVGAADIAARDVGTLSDGERQRIMVARALAQEPLALLLDEPTAFLDVAARVELLGLLRHLAHDEGLAVIVSTHDLELAMRTADTVWLVLPEGRLSTGAPEDVILAGDVARAFERGRVRFSPDERTFRLPPGGHGRAVVRGSGLFATLAAAVLEREGYDVEDASEAPLVVTIAASGDEWQVTKDGHESRGQRFAELANRVRQPRTDAAAQATKLSRPRNSERV